MTERDNIPYVYEKLIYSRSEVVDIKLGIVLPRLLASLHNIKHRESDGIRSRLLERRYYFTHSLCADDVTIN